MGFPKILQGVRVADFSRLLPGPFASELLIKMGAEVQCILPPEGDPLLGNYSPFASLKRGKKFEELDLKSEMGMKRAKAILKDSDILLEGFRPGAMDRLGLGFSEATQLQGHILYVSLNGYGADHAKYLQGAHDLNFLVDSGVYSLMYPDDARTIPLIQLADLIGGMYAAFHILMEWIARRGNPTAKHLKVSIVEGVSMFAEYLQDPGVSTLLPMLTGGVARYHIFVTKDERRIAVAAIEPKFFQNLVEALGLPYDGHSDGDEVIATLAKRFSERTLQEWKNQLQGLDACLSFIPTRDEVLHQSKKASAT